jgi:hypothetical protein
MCVCQGCVCLCVHVGVCAWIYAWLRGFVVGWVHGLLIGWLVHVSRAICFA